MVKKMLMLMLMLTSISFAAEMKQIVFIYTSNAKQVNAMSADVASIPLFRVGDEDSTVVAYAGVLWECQVPAKDKAAFDQKIKAKPVYVKYSEPMEADEINHWLEEQGYARVAPKEEVGE
jgi:hypothetical protein